MSAPPPRWHATPLDPASAQRRADQVEALTDPERLRLLSALAARDGNRAAVTSLAGETGLEPTVVGRHLAALAAVGLVVESDDDADTFVPTADTWVRFGRLLLVQDGPLDPPSRVAGAARPVRGAAWPADLPTVLDRIADRLAYQFQANFSRETVDRYVADSYRLLAERASVTRHLPSLTSRFAADRLSALATLDGRPSRGVVEVLFVCVQNAGRSQIAAAALRHLAGDRVHVRTAGSRPAARIDPQVLAVLDEVGLPVVAEFPKPLTDEVVQAADVVVTMGCGDACPLYPGRRYLDWPVPDPVGQPMDEVREIRDAIITRVEDLVAELGIVAGSR